MWGRKDELPLPRCKVSINPSYEWSEDARALGVSHRELEVFALLMDGHDNREIGQILDIQYQSVKNHTFNLYRKLSARNMAEAMKLLLFGNCITVEPRGISWKYDREKWMRETKWLLDESNTRVTERERQEAREFLLEHEIYGKFYADRLKELREDEDKQT